MTALWLRHGATAALALGAMLAHAQEARPDPGAPGEIELGLTGALRSNYYRSSKTFDDERDFAGATLQLKAAPALADGTDAKLSLRVTDPVSGEAGAARGRLIEGFVAFRGERADLRLGRQIVAWGRADGINPTDNLTPRDYTVMLPFEDDQRFGTDSARLDLAATHEHTVSLFATPFFEPSRIPVPRTASLQDRRPRERLGDAQLGMRLNKVGEGLDWSLSYFSGHSLLPTLRPAAPGVAGGVMTYDAIRVLGADFARNLGRYGFRGEVAYTRSEDRAGTDPFARNPQLYWVLGVDRTFLDNLNLNVQFFQRRVRAYRPPDELPGPAERAFAAQSSLLAGQRDRVNSGITLRASNKWLNDTLEAEIFLIRNAGRRDLFLRPLVTYAFSDHWKGTLGVEYYRGSADTQFGSQTANKGAFLELRYGF